MDGNGCKLENSVVICKFCEEAFTLGDEDEVDSNLPRVLLCGHIFCSCCLLSLEVEGVIRCPECEVEMTVPEGGVDEIQEESRIIGLIYSAKMNKTKRLKNCQKNRRPSPTDMNAITNGDELATDDTRIENTVDQALAQAAENLAQLEQIHETLTNGLAEQVLRERARLEMEITQAAKKACCAVQKWKDVQLNQLTDLEAKFSTTRTQVCSVGKRIEALKVAMQMAKNVCRVPLPEQYHALDESQLLEKMKDPVDDQSLDMKCVTVGSGMSCVFQSDGLNQSLSLSLKMEDSSPKDFPKPSPKMPQLYARKHQWHRPEGRNSSLAPHNRNKNPSQQKQDLRNSGSYSVLSPGPNLSAKPRRRLNLSHHSPVSDLQTPDVVIEEYLDEKKGCATPPTCPDPTSDKQRIQQRSRDQFDKNRNVANPWVVVTHVENPNHFYIHYLTEKREIETLAKKINQYCCSNAYQFKSSDTVETESLIFVKWKEGLWCRATVVEVQAGCEGAVKDCPVQQLVTIRVFLLDYGVLKTININSEEEIPECSLRTVNNQLRKVGDMMKLVLCRFAPLAVRCSLKDLVPYDLSKGWSKEAQIEFQNVVGSAAVEMRVLGQDKDNLLVDLKKVPVNKSSNVPVSVRDFLVFVEVARFYHPVTLGRKPLLYYPPVYPKMNTALNVMVSHIHNPADFYIKLVDNMESILLSTKLQRCYNATPVTEDELSIYCPVVGQAYVARYDDRLWYRAQVIGLPGDRKVKVFYVDFGNEDILSVSDLRKIKEEFFALPCMAIHSCLSNLIPLNGGTWSDACTDRFISLVSNKLVTIVVTANVPRKALLPVKLVESSLGAPMTDIADLLVKEELALFKTKPQAKDKKSEVQKDDDCATWDPPLEEPMEFQPLLKMPDQLSDLKVRVSHVNSPSSFYVQLTQNDSHLKRVCELLKQECVNIEPQDVAWKADMFCAAQMNKVWERGKICSDVTSGDIAEVMRCDHGNTVKLHVKNLLPLPSSLIGSFALECTLTDVRPAGGRTNWTATACDLFSHYLNGAFADMTIKEMTDERPVPAVLFCSNKTGQLVSIADFLVSEGLALKERKPRNADVQNSPKTDAKSPVKEAETDGVKKTLPKAAPRTIMSAAKVKTQLYQPPELPCLGHFQMSVSAIGEDGIIYVRTQNAECQLEQLRQKIQQSMKTLPRQKPYTWKTVMGCAVLGSDMLWYRGQLLEVLEGVVKDFECVSEVCLCVRFNQLQYVDYGTVENIPMVHVYPILLNETVPQLCIPCQLHRINPVAGGWHWDAVALMKELLLSRPLDLQELPTDPRGPIRVEIFLDGMSLSRILCHHEHASMDPTVSAQEHSPIPPAFLDDWDIDAQGLTDLEEKMLGPYIKPILPQMGEEFQVKVKHLLTPNQLFLWPLEGTAEVEVDGETLDEALRRINADISSLPQLSNFPKGGPCLAEYSDGKYYRAKLIKFASIEPVLMMVQHVDFGSDDILPTSKIRQMPPELLRFPTQVLQVKVSGFKPPSVNDQEDVLPYSPGWSVKAAMFMIKLLHDNITAFVVAQEPELLVQLYTRERELVHMPLVSSGLAEVD